MSAYDIVNFADVENVAPKFDLGDVQEARFPSRALGCTQTGLSRVDIKPGQHSPFAHHHREQEELYVVVAGSGRALLGDETREITTWDVLRVSPETVRSFAAGPEGLSVLAFGPTVASGGTNDAELVPAEW